MTTNKIFVVFDFLFLVIFLGFANMAPTPETSPNEYTNVADDAENKIPETMLMQFTVKNENMTLNLTKNKHIDIGCNVVLLRDGKLQKWKTRENEDFAAFTDVENKAAIIVHKEEFSDKKSYMGVFSVGNENFIIKPIQQSQSLSTEDGSHVTPSPSDMPDSPLHNRNSHSRRSRRRRRSARVPAVFPGVHEILPAGTDGSNYEHDTRETRRLLDPLQFNEELRQHMGPESPLAQNMQHGVGVLMFADYSIYKRFYDQIDSTDSKKKKVPTATLR